MRRRLAGLVLAAGFMCASAIGAESPPKPQPLDVAAFAEVPALEGPELSPNGKMLAAKIAVQGTQYFTILPLDGGKPRYVALGDNDLNWWRWVNDDWLILGVGQQVPVEGDDWYVRRAVSVSAVDGKLVRLATRDAGQNADDVLWVANDGSPRILMASQTSIYTNDPGFWPGVDEINVSNGRRKSVLAGRSGVFNWYADGAGTIRMGIGRSDDGRSRRVLYRPDAHSSFRTIDKAGRGDDDLLVPSLFLKDPNKAVMISDDDEGYSALYELDLQTLERGKQLVSSKGYDLGGLITDQDGFGYIGYYVNEDRPGIRWTDPALEALEKTVASKIKGGSPRIVSLSRDRSVAIVHVGSADAPGAYFIYRAAEDTMDLLQLNNSAIRMKHMHPVRTIRYKARDGLEIAAVLTLPKGKSANLPLIVMPHGGPRARDSEEWDWWAQFLADRGYAVIQPNYRGSTGYGTSFMRKGEGQWGLAMQDDLNDAVTALAAQGIADPKRVCMVGASYGGYAALRAAERDGRLYRCAVSYAGVSDLTRWMRQDSNSLWSGAKRDWVRTQAPDLKGVSPVNDPEGFSIPVLIVHGKKDQTVPVVHSRVMAQKLKAAGKDAIYIEQPLADHHFTRSEDRLEFLKALESFLAKHNPA
ncbi:S9 family peptidase [Sphingomonas cannabina]|uniref:alpha/beta hydrolase family protein n=1 Tax=Sphingomonas cannabina TaxID=2899123 RepID=UPI001F3A5FCE|nr:S9 family peptidase [Sphingomonas cannabina]UIJ44389.1 S9 family peptidase [Sphingomonas cannabina]